jgi:hypothetical protein
VRRCGGGIVGDDGGVGEMKLALAFVHRARHDGTRRERGEEAPIGKLRKGTRGQSAKHARSFIR